MLLWKEGQQIDGLQAGVASPAAERMRLRLAGHVVFPRLTADRTIGFDSIAVHGTLLTVTDEWIVSLGDNAFTLLATPTPHR